jgi:murein DD-endopeptidase MepM/ murein hydrolase activator NlpD
LDKFAGSIVGNSLKTIFSRITTNSQAIGALADIGINIEDSAGKVKDVSAIIGEIAGKWNELSDAERQNTSVKVAGTNQLSRFNALMLNYDMGLKATESSIHSQNSAMSEQNKYAESLEARINRLKNAWYGFANEAGSSILYDGIVVLTSIFQGATDGAGSFISEMGALGPILGTVGVAVVLLNKNFRNLVISMGVQAQAAVASSTATTLFGRAAAGAAGMVKALNISVAGLMATLGVGAVFFAVGFAIEKLTSVISENIRMQEKMDAQMKANKDALGVNKTQVDELIKSYESMRAMKEYNSNAWTSENEEKYLDVQQRLAELMPSLVDHIDATGQAHLKSAEGIQKAKEATEELVKAEQNALISGAEDKFNKQLEGINGKWWQSMSNFLNNTLEGRIKDTEQVIEALTARGMDTSKQEFKLAQLQAEVASQAGEIKASMLEVTNAINSVNDVEINPNVQQSLEAFIETLELPMDSAGLKDFAKEFAEVQKLMSNAISSKDSKAFEEATQKLNALTAKAKNGKEDFKQFKISYDEFIGAIEKGKTPVADSEGELENLAEATGELIDVAYEYANATERMAGVTQKQIDDTSDLLSEYTMLSHQLAGYTEEELKNIQAKKSLSGAERILVDALDKRDTVMQQLLAIYPSLLDADGKAIELTSEKIKAIEKEQEANKVLLKAYQLMKDGKLSAEQQATLAAATGTRARIDFLKKEIQMLTKYVQANEIAAKAASVIGGIAIGGVAGQMASIGMMATGATAGSAVSGYKAELEGLQSSLDVNISSIKNFSAEIENSSKSTKGNSKATKDNNSEKEKSIYIADKYKRKLEEINEAMARQNAIMEAEQKGSNKRRLALAETIKLEQQRLQVMKDQEKALKNQVATGKIAQTGNVKQTAQTTQTIAGGKRIGGAFDHRISSTFGSRADNHRGVDFAAARNTAINSPVSGKVIAAGSAKSQGQHWSYGNLVIVQDSSGVKHIMAHMEKVMAKVGDQIVAGTKVGTVGSTGNSTGPHLHYEQNKNGKVLNPNAFVNQIRSGKVTTASGTVTSGGGYGYFDNGAEAVDKARSDLSQLSQDIISTEQAIAQLQVTMVEEILASYQNRITVQDRTIQNTENNMKKLSQSSDAYRAELDKQAKALLNKRKINQEEIVYLQNTINKGKLSGAALADLTDKLQELKNESSNIDSAISDNYLAKIESLNVLLEETATKYDKMRTAQDKVLEYQNVQMKELDSTSKEYVKSLTDINTAMKNKQSANRKELNDLTALIKQGKFYGSALTNARDRVQELQTQIKQLQIDIQEGDFEILVSIKNQSDEVTDDIQFEMSRLEEIRKMYEEGSADYGKYTEELIEWQKKLADQHLATRDALLAELKQRDITKDRIKEVKELLEDEHIAYLQATNAIKDYQKQLENANKTKAEDIANKVISALKDAYQELRDERMKMLDEEAKKATEVHNKRLKELKEEQDLFRKNVEERLRLIDRQEAERGYNMEIDDMEKERNKIQERINTLSMDDSYSAKKERKNLQEQLDKIDKDIAERRHQRDIELQKQGLNDLLELKDQEIEGKTEAENEAHDELIASIDRQKQYWEKYYQDLLNDERKFAQIRQDILNGHFDKVQNELQEHISHLTATMPQLADSMDGTMQAVGTAIRQNVIDNLQNAMDKMLEFKQLASEITNSFTDNFNPNDGFGNTGGAESSNGNLTSADMEVLLGKFLYDNVAPALTGVAQKNARDKGRELGQSGYKGGSSIDSGLNFGSAMQGLTSAEREAFKQYLQSNMGMSSGKYDKYFQEFLGGKEEIVNAKNPYGVQTPMSYGDMQVLMAKYMREILITPQTAQSIKNEIQPQANQMASEGRAAGSKIGSDSTYAQVLNSLDKSQRSQFKSFLGNQSGIIKNQDLKYKAKNYAASLNTGGMLNNRNTTGGVDGIGGQWFIGHKGEVVNNPIETSELLQTVDSSRVMLQHLKGIIRPLENVKSTISNISGGETKEEYNINFNGDFVNMNKTTMDRLAGTAMETIKTKKGKF